MCALRQGVDARIGSSGTVNAHRLTTNAFKCAFDMVLDRVAMRLTLPAGKSGPVISNN